MILYLVLGVLLGFIASSLISVQVRLIVREELKRFFEE